MKKVISLMLAMAMVFGLAACGSPKQTEQEAPVETEAPAETEGAECGLYAQLCINVGYYGRIGRWIF